MDEATATFESHRPRLLGIAYRMLGSLAEAQDVVQETYLRWHKTARDEIRNEGAWLTTACTRLALNQLNSARARREQYVGEWLPEPYPPTRPPVAGEQWDLDDSVSCALLVTLERLTPNERAAYLLHDVFDYSFGQIAEMLELTAENCRKLASRARQHIRAARPRFDARVDEHERLIDGFMRAAREGDIPSLLAVLSPEAVMTADGGGKATTVSKPLHGAEKIARFFAGVWRDRGQADLPQTRRIWFNGAPGIAVFLNGRLISTVSIDVQASRIARLYAVRNPDKLAGLETHFKT